MNIEINFQDTIAKANRLEELAEKMNTICTGEIAEAGGNIAVNWEGDARELYKQSLERVNQRLINEAKSLRQIAQLMGKGARRLKKVEDLAKSIFLG